MMTMMMMTNMSENVTFKKKTRKIIINRNKLETIIRMGREKKNFQSECLLFIYSYSHQNQTKPKPKTIGDDHDHRHFF